MVRNASGSRSLVAKPKLNGGNLISAQQRIQQSIALRSTRGQPRESHMLRKHRCELAALLLDGVDKAQDGAAVVDDDAHAYLHVLQAARESVEVLEAGGSGGGRWLW